MPGYVAMFVRSNADRYLLRTFLGLAQVGVFEMLYKFATLIGFLVGEPFLRTWTMRQLEICENEEGPSTMAEVFTIHLAIMLFAGLVLALEIPLLLKFLTPPEFWVGGNIALLAVLSLILGNSYYHFSFGLVYTKSTMQISWIQVATAIVGLAFNLLLIPQYGIAGAVVSSCLAAAFQCMAALKIAQKHYFIPYQWKRVGYLATLFTILYLLIAPLDLGRIGLGPFFQARVFPVASEFLHSIHFDTFRGGKYLDQIVGNFDLLAEGGIKLVLSLAFGLGSFFIVRLVVQIRSRGRIAPLAWPSNPTDSGGDSI